MAKGTGNEDARRVIAFPQAKGALAKAQNKAAFGHKIREYRIKKGLSQPQLAALLGVTKTP